MDIDKLFKMPALPERRSKRPLLDNPTPEIIKRLRMDNGSQHMDMKARVEDINDDDSDIEPRDSNEFAPGNDADYFVEDDEEGRFYGGGLTNEQKDILNIFDNAPSAMEGAVDEDIGPLDTASVRRCLIQFERAVNKNQDQRSKYPDEPSKFIDSEADLDTALKTLLPMAQVAPMSYPEFINSGAAVILTGLLSHENLDIVMDVVEVIKEFTDEDVEDEQEVSEDRHVQSREKALNSLVNIMVEHSLLELLSDNLSRFNEEEESDRQGLYNVLGIFENILSISPQLAVKLVHSTVVMKWLLRRIESKTHDDNRSYAAELLSILLQGNSEVIARFGSADGIDTLLRVSSQFRNRDPVDDEEVEFLDNLFDCMASSLSDNENRRRFAECEGVELLVLMLKEKLECRSRALKVLDYALNGLSGTENCKTFVDHAGLKSLFSIFMGTTKAARNLTASPLSADSAHCLGIFYSLLSNLDSDGVQRLRLLRKFVENTYSSVDRLLEVRETASRRLKVVEAENDEERKIASADSEGVSSEEEEMWYLKRLDGGLYTMQSTDYVLSWLIMEDDGIRNHVELILSRHSKSVKDIASVLEQQLAAMAEGDSSTVKRDSRDSSQSVIMTNLLQYLKSL